METSTSIVKGEKVELKGASETLMLTLRAKALDSRTKKPLLHDNYADHILKTINYDFTKFEVYKLNYFIVVRARQFDEWVREFLASHDDAVVVNLACGLDSRILRIKPSPDVLWLDVDLPDVISIRKKFYQETDHYRMIASSALDPDWMREVPSDRPLLILAEGLLEYLTEGEVRKLFNLLTTEFFDGQVIFDVMSSFAIESARKRLTQTTGAVHRWAVDSAEAVDALDSRLQRISSVSVFTSRFAKELPLKFRILYALLSMFATTRYMMRLMRYGF